MTLSQREMVVRHLEEFGSINPLQAFADYGIMRLGAIIYNLRQEGYTISTELSTGRNRYGNQVHYAVYKKGAE